MRILRGIRMMLVRMITRAMWYCELRATCFPEGGVPTNSSTQLPLNVTDHVHQLRQVSTYLHGSPSQQRSHSELEEIIKVFNIICMLQGVHLFIIIIGKYPKFPIS